MPIFRNIFALISSFVAPFVLFFFFFCIKLKWNHAWKVYLMHSLYGIFRDHLLRIVLSILQIVLSQAINGTKEYFTDAINSANTAHKIITTGTFISLPRRISTFAENWAIALLESLWSAIRLNESWYDCLFRISFSIFSTLIVN